MKQYDTKYFENGSTDKTGMDNRPAVGSESERLSLGIVTKSDGVLKTIETSNAAGSIGAVYSIEELEELESRGVNSNFDLQRLYD